ncbi:LiaI-LiaF-like domain-containing protein [Ottowia sp.]|uniref:LiaI-LiaF-like domain-containing protein n=1 Tax=Ottowia sp. TaxID=1898956 RepID=UPI002BC3C9F1|nr:DUF5668 domain-containing protein [Ottowia sp.]
MRIFPLALIAIGVIALLKHFGLIDPEFMRLFWPLLLIAIGVAMLVAGPRWRAHARERMQGQWERRMHRRFGPGWNRLSEEERDRFRAGMNQWHGCGDQGSAGATPVEPPAPRGPR